MEPFDSLRDTVVLLTGAKTHRTPRPGERFEVPEQSRRSMLHRGRLRLYLNRFRREVPKTEDCSSEGAVYAQPTIP